MKRARLTTLLPRFKFIILMCLWCGTLFPQVRFSADFESGNMESVSTTDSVTFTVRTKADIGGRWFYFKMSGVKNRFIRVKVSGSDVKRAMFSYDNTNYLRFAVSESPAVNTFEKTYTNDSVYVAYYTPYTLTYLNKRITAWLANSACSLDTIGYTKRGLPLYEVTATDRSVPDSVKEHIWIHARTHPGETPSSWQFDGLMKTLLSNNDVAKFYLKKLVSHCIPFTNPDGVYYGRSRTNYDSIDVESNWNKADSLTCREVLLLKQRMLSINQKKVLKVFLNMHSQAAAYCTFWIHTAASTSSWFYRRELQFASINISDNPYFVYNDFSYSTLSMTFPEGWQWKQWGEKTMALTYETPYDYYSSGAVVDSVNLAYLGERTLYSIGEYLELSHPQRMILDNAALASTWLTDTVGTDYFGKDFLYAAPGTGAAVFSSGALPAGRYDVYGWWTANAAHCPAAKITLIGAGRIVERLFDQRLNGGRWNKLETLSLPLGGEITISVSDSGSGKIIADAFRILYAGSPANIEYDFTDTKSFNLYQNYPNPFNAQTTLRFEITNRARVRLAVFDALGNEIETLFDGEKTAGSYDVLFNARELPSGMYFARLSVNGASITKPMMLLK
jgi:hypothetical protein